MRRPLAWLSLLALLGLALLAAGCGGGDGDRLTKEEYATQANEICTDFNKKIEVLGEPKSIAEFGEFADKTIPIFEDGISDLRGLNPPEELEETVDAWLATADAALERIRKIGDAARDGDEAEVNRLIQEASAAEQGSDALARQVGATTCAED